LAKHLHIVGAVQGVGYRAAFSRQARSLNLSGWVRNRLDGSVEAIVSGDPGALERIIAWARSGPPHAGVSHVSVSEATDTPASSGTFEILPTA